MGVDVQIIDCPGAESWPKYATTQEESTGSETAECSGCGGRFHLADSGLIPRHAIPVPLHAQVVVGQALGA